MTNMWHPYQSSTSTSKATSSSPNNTSTSSSSRSPPVLNIDTYAGIVPPPASNSPLDSANNSSSSSISNSSSTSIGRNQQTPLSIASLIPTPSSYDDDEEQLHHQHQNETSSPMITLNHPHHQVDESYYNAHLSHSHYNQHHYISQQNSTFAPQQTSHYGQYNSIVSNPNGRSSSGGSSSSSSENISLTNSSDVSATSSPTTYRSPTSTAASYYPNYQGFGSHPYHPHHQQYYHQISTSQHGHHHHPGYQHFADIDFNNPYYAAASLANTTNGVETLKSKQENADYHSSGRFSSNATNQNILVKSEIEESDYKPHQLTPPNNPVNSSSSPNYTQAAAAAAYYNNMSLNSTNPPQSYSHPHYYSHTNPYQHLPHSAHNSNVATAAAVAAAAAAAAAVINNTVVGNKEKLEKNTPSINGDDAPSSPPSSLGTLSHHNLKTNNNPNIKVKLQDMSLWKQFNTIGTEMIITKCGRRMFPSLRVSISGLEASSKYLMVIDIIPVDDNRYKYHNCEWIVSGKAEAHFAGRGYLHPDSPLTGSQWMKQIISFHKLKLTNNPFDRAGHIILNSMHKYVPRLHIIEEGKSISTFIFTDAIFTAVTAYQNESITKLKIEYNPFAKGFRDGQSRKDYRNGGKRGSDDENDYQDENSTFSQMLANSNNAKYAKITHKEPNGPLAAKDLNTKYNNNNHHMQHQQQHQQQNFNNYSNSNNKLPIVPIDHETNTLNSNTLLYDY